MELSYFIFGGIFLFVLLIFGFLGILIYTLSKGYEETRNDWFDDPFH